jgi:hypothetical protein
VSTRETRYGASISYWIEADVAATRLAAAPEPMLIPLAKMLLVKEGG